MNVGNVSIMNAQVYNYANSRALDYRKCSNKNSMYFFGPKWNLFKNPKVYECACKLFMKSDQQVMLADQRWWLLNRCIRGAASSKQQEDFQ